jgi:DNA-3-methyladenine glycosylase
MLVKENAPSHTTISKMLSRVHEFAPLPRTFYEPSAAVVAPRLLGHWLVRNTSNGPVGGPIVETEAYVANDAACHAFPGLTPRNKVMFGAAGHAYVYLIYGLHFCVNAVCQPAGLAEAVLVRAIEAAVGLPAMRTRRDVQDEHCLTNGPAKLCEALGIDRRLNGVDLCNLQSELVILKNPNARAFRSKHGPLVTAVRIGITRAAELPLRFYLEGSQFVSGRKLRPRSAVAKPVGRNP